MTMVDLAVTPKTSDTFGAPTASIAAGRVPETTVWTRLVYGFGSVAFGVKDNGFSYFLLLYYSQAIGLDSRLVGLAITIALVFDAFADPLIGYWSDNLRSRWGRRHWPDVFFVPADVRLLYGCCPI
jgi:MFS family permease